MLKIHCPHCDDILRVADDRLGKKVRCPTCEEVFTADESHLSTPRRKKKRKESDGETRRYAPHKGILTIVLGVISILLAVMGMPSGPLCVPLGMVFGVLSLIVGVAGWLIGQRDKTGLSEGWIDPAAKGIVMGGWITSMVGTGMGIFVFLVCSLGACILNTALSGRG